MNGVVVLTYYLNFDHFVCKKLDHVVANHILIFNATVASSLTPFPCTCDC